MYLFAALNLLPFMVNERVKTEARKMNRYALYGFAHRPALRFLPPFGFFLGFVFGGGFSVSAAPFVPYAIPLPSAAASAHRVRAAGGVYPLSPTPSRKRRAGKDALAA